MLPAWRSKMLVPVASPAGGAGWPTDGRASQASSRKGAASGSDRSSRRDGSVRSGSSRRATAAGSRHSGIPHRNRPKADQKRMTDGCRPTADCGGIRSASSAGRRRTDPALPAVSLGPERNRSKPGRARHRCPGASGLTVPAGITREVDQVTAIGRKVGATFVDPPDQPLTQAEGIGGTIPEVARHMPRWPTAKHHSRPGIPREQHVQPCGSSLVWPFRWFIGKSCLVDSIADGS